MSAGAACSRSRRVVDLAAPRLALEGAWHRAPRTGWTTQKCGDPADEAGCVANKGCWESGWRTSTLDDLASCLNARACGASDDPCHASAGAAVPKTAVMNDYFAKCSKWMDCGGSDDLCYSRAAVLSDATLQSLAICFDKPCADQEPCAEPILSSVYCW